MLTACTVAAQDSVVNLQLQQAVDAALAANSSVKLAKLDEQIASAQYKQTDAIFLPQVGFSYAALGSNNPLNVFGFKLQQKSVTAADFNPALLNNPGSIADFTTKIEIQQPLINLDALYQRKAAAKQMEVYGYKTQRTRQYLAFETQSAFLQLQLAYDALAVAEEALVTMQSVRRHTNNYFEQGLLQKSDLLNVDVQVSSVKTNIAKAKSNIRNASDMLSMLMGNASGATYKPVADAPSLPQATAATLPQNRADFLAMQKAIEASNLMIVQQQKSWLPRLNAFGSYQLNDRKPLGFSADAYLAGVQLTWNIFKGNSVKNAIATQTLERQKMEANLSAQKEQAQLEINKTQRSLGDAFYEVSMQEQAVQQATEALSILRNRFDQGLVNTTDVLTASTQLSEKKFGLAQAKFNQRLTAAYLGFLQASAE